MGRSFAFVIVAVAVTSSGGCERGCLTTWLHAHGVGRVPGESAEGDAGEPFLDLTGTDCSPGLARCAAGVVEVSRAAHLSSACGGPGERPGKACACPWDARDRCARGCVAEGVTVVAAPEAAQQLCRPSEVVARPPLPSEVGAPIVCAEASLVCEDGVVRACEGPQAPSYVVGVCLHGCAAGVAVDPIGPSPYQPGHARTADGVTAILCRRDHAERQ